VPEWVQLLPIGRIEGRDGRTWTLPDPGADRTWTLPDPGATGRTWTLPDPGDGRTWTLPDPGDGRTWTLLDPGATVANFTARKADLPVDHQHASDAALAQQSGPGLHPRPAAGWTRELRLAAHAPWGRVEWTDRANCLDGALIGVREWRCLSPVFRHDKAGRIGRLKGAGLAHTPTFTPRRLPPRRPRCR